MSKRGTSERWAIVCEGRGGPHAGRVIYSVRDTLAEVSAILANPAQRALAERFGTPKVERVVVSLLDP